MVLKEPKMKYIFSPGKRVSITLSATITSIQAIYPSDHINFCDLPCGLCHRSIGPKRPIGIAWGSTSEIPSERSFRLCNACYIQTIS